MNTRPHTRSTRRDEGGYVVALTLVLLATILTLSVTMMNHVVERNQTSTVTSHALGNREAAFSGMQLAQQSMKIGVDLDAASIGNGEANATVETTSLDTFTDSIHSQVLDANGLGATLYAEAVKVAAPEATQPSSLPRIDTATLSAIMADSTIPKHYYSGHNWVYDTEIDGLVIIADSSALFLDDVVINGCIVTTDALSSDPAGDYDPDHAPCAVVMGTLRVVPGDFLPGVSVVMPEGLFTAMSTSANIQLEGDVIAHSLSIPDTGGAILGNVCTVADVDYGDAEHALTDRGAEPWAPDLDTGSSWTTGALAFVPYRADPSTLTAITAFAEGQ